MAFHARICGCRSLQKEQLRQAKAYAIPCAGGSGCAVRSRLSERFYRGKSQPPETGGWLFCRSYRKSRGTSRIAAPQKRRGNDKMLVLAFHMYTAGIEVTAIGALILQRDDAFALAQAAIKHFADNLVILRIGDHLQQALRSKFSLKIAGRKNCRKRRIRNRRQIVKADE